jgi:hypothetical protein
MNASKTEERIPGATYEDASGNLVCPLELAFRQVEKYPVTLRVDYGRRYRALMYLVHGGDPVHFDDQEALESGLKLYRHRVAREQRQRQETS